MSWQSHHSHTSSSGPGRSNNRMDYDRFSTQAAVTRSSHDPSQAPHLHSHHASQQTSQAAGFAADGSQVACWQNIQDNLETVRRQIAEAEERERKAVTQIRLLSERNEELRREVEALHHGKEELRQNYGRMMEEQLSANESKVEAIGSTTSPMSVKEEYANFASQELLAAKEILERTDKSRTAKLFDISFHSMESITLPNIMKLCYKHAHKRRRETEKDIHAFLRASAKYPAQTSTSKGKNVPEKDQNKPEPDGEIELLVKKKLRKCIEETNFIEWTKDMKIIRPELLPLNPELAKFFKRCLEICWKMVLQSPVMEFDVPERESTFDERTQTQDNTNRADGFTIRGVIIPGLRHGDTLIHKATVILGGDVGGHRHDAHMSTGSHGAGGSNKRY